MILPPETLVWTLDRFADCTAAAATRETRRPELTMVTVDDLLA